MTEDGDRSRCTPENCAVQVDSDDEFGEAAVRVTISLGVVSCPELDVASQDDLPRAADELLYKAKANGRDRVARPA